MATETAEAVAEAEAAAEQREVELCARETELEAAETALKVPTLPYRGGGAGRDSRERGGDEK